MAVPPALRQRQDTMPRGRPRIDGTAATAAALDDDARTSVPPHSHNKTPRPALAIIYISPSYRLHQCSTHSAHKTLNRHARAFENTGFSFAQQQTLRARCRAHRALVGRRIVARAARRQHRHSNCSLEAMDCCWAVPWSSWVFIRFFFVHAASILRRTLPLPYCLLYMGRGLMQCKVWK